MNPGEAGRQPSIGLVMSGGGARGAYEVGVLSYLFGQLAERHGRVPRFDTVSGTSVGGVNCTALAASAHDPAAGVQQLANVWLRQQLSDVLQFNLRQMPRLYRVWLGGGTPSGIFDSKPLGRLINREIPWRQLVRNIKQGRVRALTIAATNISTGRATLYIDRAPGVGLPYLEPRVVVRPTHILPQHVLASAAMPLVFPPVRIGNDYFCDGGIRLNTPTAPAIHLGVDKLLVIGVSTPGVRDEARRVKSPGAAFMLGKALNALMLDHIAHDLEEVRLVNQLLQDVQEACGERCLTRLHEHTLRQGRPAKRIVDTLALRPSVDIGEIAEEHLRTNRARLRRVAGHMALRLLDVGEGAEADLASYLLFDGDFARVLMELGRHDAAAVRDELETFLFAPAER